MLGPAVVGLAVPLAREWNNVKKLALPVIGALTVGALVAIVSAVGFAYALGASPSTISALATKSVTAPIAMGIAEHIGGLPALAPVFAVTTGIVGATVGKYVLDAVGVRAWRARGFALGIAARGIGTARAFQVNPIAGVYAGLAFGLHGALAAPGPTRRRSNFLCAGPGPQQMMQLESASRARSGLRQTCGVDERLELSGVNG